MHGWISDVAAIANAGNNGPDDLLRLFFEVTETSRQKGRDYLKRFMERQDRDKPSRLEVRDAQYDAITEWGIPDPTRLNRLAGVTQPVLITAGDNDTMIPTVNAYLMAQHLPEARVRVYPDAGHGFLFQWPVEFAEMVTGFLAETIKLTSLTNAGAPDQAAGPPVPPAATHRTAREKISCPSTNAQPRWGCSPTP